MTLHIMQYSSRYFQVVKRYEVIEVVQAVVCIVTNKITRSNPNLSGPATQSLPQCILFLFGCICSGATGVGVYKCSVLLYFLF